MQQINEKQQKHLQILMDEAVTGITQRDILPNTAQPLQEEVEAMYFIEINHFFENSISRRVMDSKQIYTKGNNKMDYTKLLSEVGQNNFNTQFKALLASKNIFLEAQFSNS